MDNAIVQGGNIPRRSLSEVKHFMNISTSTNIVAFTATRERLPVEFCIETCAEAGYRVLDINFCIAMNPSSPMRGDDWEGYVRRIGQVAEKCGVVFTQSHLPYYDVCRGSDRAPVMEELIRRSIIGSGMLGVKWAVTHPFTVYGQEEDEAVQRQANLDYYAPHMALARSCGLGIALETDFDLPEQRIYCSRVDELIRLRDAFHDETAGICYDFGHANLMPQDGTHREKLNRIGSRLKALHVQDNHGETDEHLLPFFGSIDWADAMAGLRDIGFQGDLTFEVQEFGRALPKDMKHLTAELSLTVGKRLLEMVNNTAE